jgi:hypothetical protein
MQQCNSFTGQLSQSLSQQNAQICGRAPAYQSIGSIGIILSTIMSIIGIALIIIGAILCILLKEKTERFISTAKARPVPIPHVRD